MKSLISENSKIKVLHLGQMIGGLDVYIRNTITYADERFEYIIVRGRDDNSKPVLKNGQPIIEYQIDLYRKVSLLKDLKAVLQAVYIIKKEKPNIIHCHSAKGGVVGRIAGFLTRTKTVYTPHAFSFLSSSSFLKRKIYLFLERAAKLDSYLLACSESERQLGIDMVHYSKDHALVWSNSVPDASKEIE